MVFYKIEAFLKETAMVPELEDRHAQKMFASELSEKSETLYQKNEQQYYVFTASVRERKANFGAIIRGEEDINGVFETYRKMLPFQLKEFEIEEVTFKALTSLLLSAVRSNYIQDDEDVLEAFEISSISERYGRANYGENILKEGLSAETLCADTDNLLFSETLRPELQRIYAGGGKGKPQGHPVHYILRTDDRTVRKAVCRVLLSALYAHGRIQNKRYCFVDYDEESKCPDQNFEMLYKSCEGGAVVIRYGSGGSVGGEFARRGEEVIAALCETALKYRNKVLTIICLPAESRIAKETFLANWGATSFVELYEDVVFGEKADNYLKAKAKKYKIRTDKKLIPVSEDQNKGYTATELNRIFDAWYDEKLRTSIYPQYRDAETTKAQIKKEKPKGSAYEALQQLIGLSEAKKVMHQALAYYKAQKLFADKGMTMDRPSMHMVFTGNPGTAKTTVARLFAQIMKENGLLSKGELLEVGRADLVGKYVGHTAPLVQQAFKKARGGVLFIDEAYSLLDDRAGMYGDEAINTIVQEMENYREDMVVIFAGYPKEMEQFLARNPGLRSRIAYHVPFADYNAEELCDIAELLAEKDGMHFSHGVREKLCAIFETAVQQEDFGNGRFARNVVEKARMHQAGRLVNMAYEDVTPDTIATLLPEDFEAPPVPAKVQRRAIGFV